MYVCVHVKCLLLLGLQTVSPKVDVREFSGPTIQLKCLLIELPSSNILAIWKYLLNVILGEKKIRFFSSFIKVKKNTFNISE